MDQDTEVVQQVDSWLENVVLGLNLCPFAKVPRDNQRIKIHSSKATSLEPLLLDLVEQCLILEASSPDELETILMVTAGFLSDFDDYLDALHAAQMLIVDQGWQGVFQIASFHPNYQFESSQPEDCENLTNRSPYPIFHLLREQSLELAIEAYGDTDSIPENNKTAIESLTETARKSLFAYLD